MKSPVTRLQKITPIAAFLNATAGVLTLIVALVLIGPAVMADRNLFAECALRNPTPLIIQDGLKFLSAATAIVLIWALYWYLSIGTRNLILVATVFGLFSVLCLLANAVLSLIAVTQAASFAQSRPELGHQLNGLIGALAFAAIIANGPWYFLVSRAALKMGQLPKGLNYLGLVMGVVSFVPPLGIIVLLLSIVWSAWLGTVFLAKKSLSVVSPQES